eukprot:219521-Pyramimonas_sp.AAC.1
MGLAGLVQKTHKPDVLGGARGLRGPYVSLVWLLRMKAMRPATAVLVTERIELSRAMYRACGAYRRYRVQGTHMSYKGQIVDTVNMSRMTSRACTADVAHNGVCVAHGSSVHVARKACR